MPDTGAQSKISSITLNHKAPSTDAGLIQRDRDIALRDLKEDSVFQPAKDEKGPYNIDISIEENRLVFRIKNTKAEDLPMLILSLKPYRRLIKDYFLIVHSYDEAMREGKPSRIEAIDMGRRGLHNEGAEMLLERLEEKISLDFDTARRLFTLICVLHAGTPMQWR